MSNQNVSKTILGYEIDKQGVQEGVNSNKTLTGSLLDMDMAAEQATKSIDEIPKATKKALTPAQQVGKTLATMNRQSKLDDIAKDAVELADKTDDAAAAVRKLVKELKEVGASSSEIQQTTRRFEQMRGGGGGGGGEGPDLGMAASRTAQTRGALEAFGIGGASGILELTEGVADLGEVAQGAKGGLGGLLKSIGPLGITAGIAAGALAFAAKTLLDAQADAVEATKGIVDANARAFDAIAQGSEAVDSLRESEETNIRAREMEREELKRLIDAGEEHIDNLSAQEKALLGIGDVLGETPIETLEKRLDETNDSIKESEKTIDTLDKNIDKVTDSASEAAPALEEVADVTAQEAVPATEDYTKAIKQSATAANTSASKIDDFNRNATASMEQLLDSSDDASDAIEDASKDMKESAQDIKRTLTDDLIDIEADIAQQRSEIIRDASRDDLQAQRDANQELKNIRRDGLRSERDAARERNFLALAESRESTRESLADEAEAEKVRRDERQIALENELTDLRLSAELTRQERMKEFARANRDLKIDFNRQLNAIKDSRKAEFDMVKFVLDQQNKLVEQQSKRRLEIERQTAEAVNDLWSQVGSRVGGSMRRGNSGGGVGSAMRSLGFFD